MSETGAFAAVLPGMQFTEKLLQSAAFSYRPRWQHAAETRMLAQTVILVANVLGNFAAPMQGETTSPPGLVLPLCPAGTRLEPTLLNACLPCLSGVTFTPTVNRRTECLECLRCRGLIVEFPCNITHNTVCRCPPDHYINLDGGCTFLALSTGNGSDTYAKSGSIVAITVNHDEERQWYEKLHVLAGITVALLVLTVGGTIVIIVGVAKDCKLKSTCSKWKRKSTGRQSKDSTPGTPSVEPLLHRSFFSSGMQTDEPIQAQLNVLCCAQLRTELDKEIAEHARTKEKLDAKEKEHASCQSSRTDEIAARELLRQEFLTSTMEPFKAALHGLVRKVAEEANARRAETTIESGNDSMRQTTDNLNGHSEPRVDSQRAAEKEAAQVIANLDTLKRKMERITEQSGTSTVNLEALNEIKAFLQNPYGYVEAPPTEIEDQDTRNTLG